MLLSQKLAGFAGGEADTLLGAHGQKKRDVLDKMKPKFIEGCKQRGHDEKNLRQDLGDWEAFTSYAFNSRTRPAMSSLTRPATEGSSFLRVLVHGGPAEPKPADIKQPHALHERAYNCVLSDNEVDAPSSNKAGDVRFGHETVKIKPAKPP